MLEVQRNQIADTRNSSWHHTRVIEWHQGVAVAIYWAIGVMTMSLSWQVDVDRMYNNYTSRIVGRRSKRTTATVAMALACLVYIHLRRMGSDRRLDGKREVLQG